MNFMHMRGKSRFFNGNVLFPSTKNLVDGHSVFRKNYGIEKFSALVGDFTTFWGNFSVPFWWKRSSRNTSVFEKFSDIGKISGYWGRVSQFSDESYNLWVLKTFVDENFCVSEFFSVSRMFTPTRVISRFSVGTTLIVSNGKIRRGPLLCF